MAYLFCNHCGHRNPPHSAFCSACGTVLDRADEHTASIARVQPDIIVGHVETPTRGSELGAKGAGEAGTAGAPGAVMNAINDALAPMGAVVTAQPFTPQRVLKALGKV